MKPTTYGKYQIVEKIGAGGFGEVFKAFDPMLNRHVAIKTCPSDKDELRQRFAREAEIAAGLQHPNIVTVFDYGLHDGIPYLVQEYLSGEDLDHKIKRRDPLSVQTKLEYLSKIAAGLRYAHSQEVIHRDVKPANVRVLDDGQVRVMDFGIAKLMNSETQLTRTGVALGTAAYLPPEQLHGSRLDLRADQFSFGVLAYELMTWERPFSGESLSSVLYAIAHKEPVPIISRWPECPPRLATMIETCLEKEPAKRYADFAEVIAEIEALSGFLAASAVMPVPERSSASESPPPVPMLAETVATDAQATVRQKAKEQADVAFRKIMIGLVAIAVVMVVGIGMLWVAKQALEGRQRKDAVAESPQVADPSPESVPGLGEEPGRGRPVLEELTVEELTVRDESPVGDARPRADRPRSSSGTATITPPARASADNRHSPADRGTGSTTRSSPPASPPADLESRPEPKPETAVPEAASPPQRAPLVVSRPYGLELDRLAPGQRVYSDRDFLYGTVPRELIGLTCLKTMNDLRREESSLTFAVSRPVEVLVAHDQRVTKKPPWLGSFRHTGQVVTVEEGGKKQGVTVYDVYARDYPAGVVKLGSNAPSRQRRKHRISQYTVCLRPR